MTVGFHRMAEGSVLYRADSADLDTWTRTTLSAPGGRDPFLFRDGARYAPATGKWTQVPDTANAPDYRTGHAAAWTGNRMVVWGGCNGSNYYDDGKSLDLATGTWAPVASSAACTPAHRAFHRAIWTGDDILVWGGVLGSDYHDDGYRFAP